MRIKLKEPIYAGRKQFEKVLQLVGFVVGGERFAVDISDIHEINRYEHINRMPELPGNVLGVIDLRGMVIPVIDLGVNSAYREGKLPGIQE